MKAKDLEVVNILDLYEMYSSTIDIQHFGCIDCLYKFECSGAFNTHAKGCPNPKTRVKYRIENGKQVAISMA